MKFARQSKHLAGVPTAHGPLKQGSVLVELNNSPEPFVA